MLESREPSKSCNFGAMQSEKEFAKSRATTSDSAQHYSMSNGASGEKNFRAVACIHFIMLAHHQLLAEHNEHVRSRHRQPQGAGGRVHPM